MTEPGSMPIPGMPRVPEPELPPLTGDYVELITESYRLGDPDMATWAAGLLAAAVLHYLNPGDGDAAAESLFVDAIANAAKELERARELLGHYPLCESITTGDSEDCGCLASARSALKGTPNA